MHLTREQAHYGNGATFLAHPVTVYNHDTSVLLTDDGRTDRQLTVAIPHFVLRASHGKNLM